MHAASRLSSVPLRTLAVVSCAAFVVGCTSPLDRQGEEALRDGLIESHRKQLESIAAGPVIQASRPVSDVEEQLTEEQRAELDAMSGTAAYQDLPMTLGPDLTGDSEVQGVQISLQRAIALAVEHNLDLAVARLTPAIAESQVIAAEAAFDSVLYSSVDWGKLDTPQPSGVVPGLSGDVRDETLSIAAGVRRNLYSGGQLTVETALTREERQPSVFGTPSFYDADVLVSLSQPLLRGFGRDISEANITLAENARESETQRLRQRLLELALDVEAAYWDLVFAQQTLLIRQRLLERTIADRDDLVARRGFDVSPVRITEANSFVELRRADVIRSRQEVRSASDRLKRLINAPDLAVADETLLLPVDEPVEAPISFSLLEAVTTALGVRPELQSALIAINDASVRQRVADNARLPLLNVAATVGINGLDEDSGGEAYEHLSDLDYIDYLISGQFELPIGNRAAEALFTQRRLERRQAVLNYQRLAQDRVLAIKDALRNVLTSYQLIGATRAARRAAADSLRAIEEQEAAGVALTPEFLLDLKLQTQERLANAETQEIEAITGYNTAIAAFYEAVGTLLKRNGIDFQDARR